MSRVDRNSDDMPVPSFAYVDRHDGRVFIKPIGADGKPHKRTIGHLTDSTPGQERMVPNQYFRDTFKELFKDAYPKKKIPAHELSIGMYALTLGVLTKNSLYALLKDCYGPIYANSLIDYVMYSILYRSGVTQIFEQLMGREVLFSDMLRSDSWYSDFFSKKIDEDMHHQLRIKWLQQLKSRGMTKVWLAIDGSNNDCEARQSHLAQFGFAKSHNANKTIVGYMYAVDAKSGMPVTYFVYEGSVPDSQAFQKMEVFLGSCGLEIEGVILDRGFAVESVFEAIAKHGWKYVIMLPGDTYAHTQMVKEHGEEIRWKSEHVLDDDALFGICDKVKLFAAHERMSSVCLLFDGGSGSQQSLRLIRKIQSEKRRLLKAISGGFRATADKALQKYLTVEGEGAERRVIINYEAWDKAMAAKGYHSLAISDGISPNECHRLYGMRGTSEIQYSILKSQEGGDTTRVHKTSGIYSKFALLFIASIIRHEIETACKSLELDTSPTLQSLSSVTLLYTAEDKYEAVRDLSTDLKRLFARFNLDQDDIERLARSFNERSRTDAKNPDRSMPDKDESVMRRNSHRRGRTAAPKTKTESAPVNKEKSRGGRPKGSKDSKPRKTRSDKGRLRGPRKAK